MWTSTAADGKGTEIAIGSAASIVRLLLDGYSATLPHAHVKKVMLRGLFRLEYHESVWMAIYVQYLSP